MCEKYPFTMCRAVRATTLHDNPSAIAALLVSILLSGVTAAPTHAQTEPYYQGKTIRIIVGFSAGGLSDQWARMFARTMPKYIPGSPNIIVQNMPGASSVVASNYIYGVAKPDGLTVGIPNSSLYLTQLIGRTEVKFDVRKFEWIGTQEKWTQMIYFRADAPFKNIGDILKAKEPPKCGASGFGSSGYILPKVLEETVGAKFNVIVGYAGGKEIDLAVEKGEVVCRGHDISSHFGREPFNSWHAKRYDRHLVQDARTRDPRLPEAPTIWEIMNEYKTPQVSRSVAETILTANDFGRALIAPPGTRADIVKLLRAAYAQMLKDSDLLAEVKKSNLDIDYTPGEQLQKLARDVMDQSPEVIEKVKKILAE
jgi:tripartite-type tricarboxylate transporter receptor subunit TctC